MASERALSFLTSRTVPISIGLSRFLNIFFGRVLGSSNFFIKIIKLPLDKDAGVSRILRVALKY